MAPDVEMIRSRMKNPIKIGDLMVHSNMIDFDYCLL